VLGVPSNDFREQEPGSAAEIKLVLRGELRRRFPADREIQRQRPRAHPFYKWVEAELARATPALNSINICWRRRGLAGAWPSTVKPTAAAITAEIEKLLTK